MESQPTITQLIQVSAASAVSTVSAVMTSAVAVTTTPVVAPVHNLSYAEKPEKFTGEMDAQTVSAVQAWNHSDFLRNGA
ncbi:hypothetical protein QVD17_09059 [Tagetes erecta]|uniref:Uncharacterized protein n=1 Tax=Tagetes erecta TaxID=13708 RepID=A0AAD8P4W2_TARER|nr:hypothetical protein QVD17_09059 [Tagetes erecta]